MTEPLLRVRGLVIGGSETSPNPVDGIDLEVREGECLALVGESGSGKTLSAMAIMGLLPAPLAVRAGQLQFRSENLLTVSERRWCELRGRHLSMVFEAPSTTLDPFASIGTLVLRPLRLHEKLDRKTARDRVVAALRSVGLANPERQLHKFPHQLSQGDCQRVVLATSLVCNPSLVILDEPTSSMDTTSQAQLVDGLERLRARTNIGTLLISHDVGLVAQVATDVAVMYRGQIVERGNLQRLLSAPTHPYTRGLLASIPPLHVTGLPHERRLPTIPWNAQNGTLVGGCRFRGRCAYRQSKPRGYERCDRDEPLLLERERGHAVRCHFAEQLS